VSSNGPVFEKPTGPQLLGWFFPTQSTSIGWEIECEHIAQLIRMGFVTQYSVRFPLAQVTPALREMAAGKHFESDGHVQLKLSVANWLKSRGCTGIEFEAPTRYGRADVSSADPRLVAECGNTLPYRLLSGMFGDDATFCLVPYQEAINGQVTAYLFDGTAEGIERYWQVRRAAEKEREGYYQKMFGTYASVGVTIDHAQLLKEGDTEFARPNFPQVPAC